VMDWILGCVGNRTAIPRLSIQQPDHSHNGYCTSIHILNVHIFNIPKQFTRFEACTAVWLRPSLLWDVTQLILCYVTQLMLCDVTEPPRASPMSGWALNPFPRARTLTKIVINPLARWAPSGGNRCGYYNTTYKKFKHNTHVLSSTSQSV
jgi:hypothetical protein